MKLRKPLFFSTSVVLVIGGVSAGGCSSDNTTADAGPDTGVDTGVADTGKDSAKVDTGVQDSGPMCPTPGDVGNFMPPTYIPAKTAVACNSGQVQGYVTNCWMMGGNCQTFVNSNMACAQCMESLRADPMTPNNDAKFGPVVVGNGLGFLNFAGCIELEGDLDCAKATQALAFCQWTSCDATCPIPPETSANYNKCTTSATTQKCKTFNDAVTTACGTEAGASANAFCRGGFNTFQDGLIKFGNIFCGGAPSDAGSDG